MKSLDLVLRGGTLVGGTDGEIRADVGIADGRIAVLAATGAELPSAAERDITGSYVLPGVVDAHTHLGVGGGMEEYTTDTAAAALGGVTSIFTILIHSGAYGPEVTRHRQAGDDVVRTDYGFHLTLMTDEHVAEVPHLVADHGITSFKYYMSFRGEEGAYLGVQGTDDGAFVAILDAVGSHGGVLAVHPENIEIISRCRERLKAQGHDDLRAWDASRPPFTEAEAVLRAAYLAAQRNCPVYFVHLSGAEPLRALEIARSAFPAAQIYAETCPHFLTHHYDVDLGSLGKVNPPLRAPADNDALWHALSTGAVDVVGSDHVGRRREHKQGSIWQASAGFPGTATLLPVLLSAGVQQGKLSLAQVADLTARRPAQIFGVADRKGVIRPGADADLAVVDLDWARAPTAEMLGTWCDYSLYEDRVLRGWPRLTYLRGQLVQEDGHLRAEPGVGQYLPRSRSHT